MPCVRAPVGACKMKNTFRQYTTAAHRDRRVCYSRHKRQMVKGAIMGRSAQTRIGVNLSKRRAISAHIQVNPRSCANDSAAVCVWNTCTQDFLVLYILRISIACVGDASKYKKFKVKKMCKYECRRKFENI